MPAVWMLVALAATALPLLASSEGNSSLLRGAVTSPTAPRRSLSNPSALVPMAPDYGAVGGSCSNGDMLIKPRLCGRTPTGTPAGQASGAYCARECYSDSDCPAGTSSSKAACTMNQGDGKSYCEYNCESDSDCPERATCALNIVSRICTYNCANADRGDDCAPASGRVCCPEDGEWTQCTGSPDYSCSAGGDPDLPSELVPQPPDYGTSEYGTCDQGAVLVRPSLCGETLTGPPAGAAPGAYCAQECYSDSDCPAGTSSSTAACTMNQGDGKSYCEYTCESDSDCPEHATCALNIVSKICTYNCSPGSDSCAGGNVCCPAGGAWMVCTGASGIGPYPPFTCFSG